MTEIEDELTRLVADSGRSLVVWRRQGPEDLLSTLANLEPCVAMSMSPLRDNELALLATVKIPLVESDLVASGSDVPARLQVEYLVAHGHERLGYLTTSEPTLERFATPRTKGFIAACAEFNLPEPRVAALPGGPSLTVESVSEQLQAWQLEPQPVTAVACFNDFHAAVCLTAATDLGLWVPHDLAVMGLDDDIFAPLTRPALTTVKLDPHGLARHLWATAQHLLDEAPEPRPYVLDAGIVERASVSEPV